jgi:hypothetical protein
VQLKGAGKAGRGLAAPTLVGRNRELGRALERLSAAEADRGALVMLRGDAGIGKTRLVAEIAGAARARGMVVRAAEASEFDQTRPFGAISDALGVSPRSADPTLAELARRIEGHRGWSGHLEDVPVEVHHLVDALTGVFESLCSTAPLLLVVDNLHWTDSSSLALLRRLTRLCRPYPALILVTTRPTDKQAVGRWPTPSVVIRAPCSSWGRSTPSRYSGSPGRSPAARRGHGWRTGWRRRPATRCSSSSC